MTSEDEPIPGSGHDAMADTMELDAVGAGQQFDLFGERYEVLAILGRGGMGTVYKARDLELDELVALKTLHPELALQRGSVARFRREVKLARRVTHKNVARIYDLHIAQSGVFLSMEYVDGKGLDELLKSSNQLPADQCIDIAGGIADALRTAHGEGVVHRDLKPANVLMTDDGRVVVTDFGIATSLGTTDDPGTFMGTPHYVSPEQARGLPVDGRSDLYSLGVVLFEMLTGAPPWTGTQPMQIVMRRFLEEPPELPPRPGVAPRLSRLVSWLLARSPDGRPPTVTSVIDELEAARLPAGETLAIPRANPTNVPLRTDAFVGRGAELAELRRRVRDEGQRLVTVFGPGGVGKTRLAQEFGTSVVLDFPGGVYFCGVDDCPTAARLVHTIAEATAVSVPSGTTDDLIAALASRDPFVLLVDRAEMHAEVVRPVVQQIVHAVPTAHLILTTRVRLQLRGAQVMEVGPLKHDDAVELFEARARQLSSRLKFDDDDRAVVDEIVEQVDRLPLSIELTAGRLRVMSPQRLLKRLSDQRLTLRSPSTTDAEPTTMESVLQGSWELLTPAAQIALAQLSVFRGGGTLDAFEFVVELSEVASSAWPEDALEELWDHSMLRIDVGGASERFELLETVRRFAERKLDAAGAVRDRHAEYYAKLARELLSWTGDHAAKLAREEQGFPNLCAACEWTIDGDDGERAGPLLQVIDAVCERRGPYTTALEVGRRASTFTDVVARGRAAELRGRALWRLGHVDEALRELEAALSDIPADSLIEADIRGLLGRIHWATGDPEKALRRLEAAAATFAAAGADERLATAQEARGLVHWNTSNLVEARRCFETALRHHRSVGAEHRAAITLSNLGLVESDEGNLERAASLYRESYDLHRKLGDRRSEAIAANNLANTLRALGELDEARDLLQRSLGLNRELGDRRMIGICLHNLGVLTESDGDHARALAYQEEALGHHVAVSDRRFEGLNAVATGRTLRRLDQIRDARLSLDRAAELFAETGNRYDLALSHCERGRIELAAAQIEAAVEHFRAARQIASELGSGPESELGRAVGALQTALEADPVAADSGAGNHET